MSTDLISKKTRQEFREYFVGTTLRQIEMAFDAADVACDTSYNPSTSGARRSLVEQYYHSIDFSRWADVRKILWVFENELVQLEGLANGTDNMAGIYSKSFESLKRWLAKDGYVYSNGHLNKSVSDSHLSEVSRAVETLDAPELQRQIDRMRSAAQDDPSLAVGTAKELLETTCKAILEETGVLVDQTWDIPRLLKETREILDLLPEQMKDDTKGLDVIRKLLGNLGTIGHSLAELRNLYGTGHGKSIKAKGLEPRHARLAVGAVATLVTFLFETHQLRKNK